MNAPDSRFIEVKLGKKMDIAPVFGQGQPDFLIATQWNHFKSRK